ncbi:MAG: TonB-dependent receptor [Acidobacteria bacterium]|nr:TonB-dependent receptor [Acidobacteriota bacterium]
MPRIHYSPIFVLFFVVPFLLFLPFDLFAQTTTATVFGSVKDETAAVLPGVEIKVTNLQTGITRHTVTGDDGTYRVSELPPGEYEVSASIIGFQTTVRTGIALTVGRRAQVDLTLKVGQIAEAVTVTGEAPLVETASSALAGLVDEKQIRELPLNGRNFVQLALLETGVVHARTTTTSAVQGTGLKMSFHGARVDFNNFMMDGTSINSVNEKAIGGSSGQAMGVETIREFQIITSNYSAEFGRAGGGVINAVTKSGTNAFGGSIFYFHRNDNLDARNFFDPGSPPEFRRNQFGVTAGGPIRKDKTFIFGGYEGLREGLGLTLISRVPNAAARNGVLPTGTVAIDPAVRPYLELWPLSNGRDFGDGRAELLRGDTQVTDQDFFQVRVDHNFSENDSFFMRYTMEDSTRETPQLIPNFLHKDDVRGQFVTIEEKKILSPRILNVFRFGFNRSDVSYVQDPLDNRVSNSSLWFIPNASVPGLGVLSVSGLDNPGGVQNRPRRRLQNVFQWTDTMEYTAGSHSFKMGAEAQRIQVNEAETDQGSGNFSFANLRNFLLAQPSSFVGATAQSEWVRGWRQTLVGLFMQDDVRLRPNLTFNLGLRWEFTTSPNEVNGRASRILNPETDTTWIVGNPLIVIPKDNLSPRLGFAWNPFGGGKTSIRGGVGLFHQMVFRHWYWTSGNTVPPFIERVSVEIPLVSFPNPFVRSAGRRPPLDFDLVEFDSGSVPSIMQYNLTLQRELFLGNVLSVSYVGSRGLHLGRFRDPNTAVAEILPDGRKFFAPGLQRRNPAWNQARFRALESSSWYNSLQVGFNRRMKEGLQLRTSYTWSHSTDDASGAAGSDFTNSNTLPEDSYDLKREWAHSNFDVRHVLSVSFTYDLPLGRGLSGTAGRFLGEWQINGIVNVTSGVPFSVENNSRLDRDRDRAFGASRPDLAPGRKNNPMLGGPDRYFDPGAFRLQEAGFYGNLGRHTVIGPGLATFDFAVIKQIRVRERSSVQFRAEFFNLLNRANFDVPGSSGRQVFRDATGVPSGDAGRIVSTTTTSRQLQFGLKVMF